MGHILKLDQIDQQRSPIPLLYYVISYTNTLITLSKIPRKYKNTATMTTKKKRTNPCGSSKVSVVDMVTFNKQMPITFNNNANPHHASRRRHYSPIFSFLCTRWRWACTPSFALWIDITEHANRCGGCMGRRMPTARHEVRLSSSLTGSFKLGANTQRLFVPIAANAFGNAVSPFGHSIDIK